MKLKDCCAIVTGSNQGLGFEIAKYFLREGAKVVLCARNSDLLKKSKNALMNEGLQDAHIMLSALDISDKTQVARLVKQTMEQFGKIDILVLNAGVHGAKGCIDQVNWDEWAEAIDINLKGSALLVHEALPYMKKNPSKNNKKMIFISGGGATKPLIGLSAYAASKAGLVRFAETLAEELRDCSIDVNCVAPGAMNTRLLDDALLAGPEKIGEKYYQQLLKQKKQGGTSPELAAALCVFLASTESDGITGKLISAVWDPWKQLPDYLEELKQTDIYTLRRIVPADRGKKWETVS